MTQQELIATQAAGSYMALIQSAVSTGATVETLERLMALKERHDANEAKRQWIEAMREFQKIKPDLPRTQQVSFGGGKAAYAFCPLPEIDKRLREPLDACGLSYRFENDDRTETGDIGVRCIVTHVAGHSESTIQYAKADTSGNKNPVQALASTRTYLMRYTLIAVFALTTADDDDDGRSGGDMPYEVLMRHNTVLRDNLKVVLAIKGCIAEKDFYQVASYMDAMPEETKSALWVAPSKGGVFTTAEIASFKSNEYAHAKADFYAEKQAQVTV